VTGEEKPQSPDSFTAAKILWIVIGLSPLILLCVTLILENMRGEGIHADFSRLSFSDPLVLVLSLAAIGIFIAAQRLTFGNSRGNGGNRLVPLIARWALFESIAVIGFVLSLVKSSAVAYLPFLFISLAGFLISSPEKSLQRRSIRSNHFRGDHHHDS